MPQPRGDGTFRENRRTEYESGIDALAAHNSRPSAYLKSKQPIVHGFGTLMQAFRADHYLGKRVRFSAFVKTENVQDWAGLWMRIDKDSASIAFDNMQNRPIKAQLTGKNIMLCSMWRGTRLEYSSACCCVSRVRAQQREI